MKKLLLLSIVILLELAGIFSLYTNSSSFIPPAYAQECVAPGETCFDGIGDLKTCCSRGGRSYKCESDGPATAGGGQNYTCKPNASDPNNNDNPDKTTVGDCIDKEQTGPCASHDQCCSTREKQLVCYPNRNGGKGTCDFPNQDPNDRNKKADKEDQQCVEKEGDACEGNGGAQDCCQKRKDQKDFKCVDKDKKPTNDSGKCEFVDINTGAKCLEQGVECKVGDWGCCGEMTCYKKTNKDGKVDDKTKCWEGMAPPPSPPCAEGQFKDGKCGAVPTAFGNIKTDPEEFIRSMFAILLSLSGGIALLLIMKSGYLIMTANGKPEAIQSGRDQLIAAIVGLIFLIFSFVILQVIGLEILKIPENTIPQN